MIGFALLNFSKEKDDMVQQLRYQAFMNGAFYLIVGVLMLPLFYNAFRLLHGASIGMPDIGGTLGALAMLLFYTYLSFRYKLHQTRKTLAADEE